MVVVEKTQKLKSTKKERCRVARQEFAIVPWRYRGTGVVFTFRLPAAPVLLKGNVKDAGRRPAVRTANMPAVHSEDATRWCRGLLRRGLASPRGLILLLRTRRLLRLCLAGR